MCSAAVQQHLWQCVKDTLIPWEIFCQLPVTGSLFGRKLRSTQALWATCYCEVQVNLNMTDHCTTDFCIWQTICLVQVWWNSANQVFVICIRRIKCIWRTNFPGPIESVISKFTCTSKGDLYQYTQITTINMYLVIEIMYDSLIQYHGVYIGVKIIQWLWKWYF